MTIFVDDMKKYLSIELVDDIDNNNDNISNKIDILGVEKVI